MKHKTSYEDGIHHCSGFPIEQFANGVSSVWTVGDMDSPEWIGQQEIFEKEEEYKELVEDAKAEKDQEIENIREDYKTDIDSLQDQRNELQERVNELEAELDALKPKDIPIQESSQFHESVKAPEQVKPMTNRQSYALWVIMGKDWRKSSIKLSIVQASAMIAAANALNQNRKAA